MGHVRNKHLTKQDVIQEVNDVTVQQRQSMNKVGHRTKAVISVSGGDLVAVACPPESQLGQPDSGGMGRDKIKYTFVNKDETFYQLVGHSIKSFLWKTKIKSQYISQKGRKL